MKREIIRENINYYKIALYYNESYYDYTVTDKQLEFMKKRCNLSIAREQPISAKEYAKSDFTDFVFGFWFAIKDVDGEFAYCIGQCSENYDGVKSVVYTP
jgi:hypothetical protein